MRRAILLLMVAIVVGMFMTGVLYVVNTEDTASINVDKERLQEVTDKAVETGKAAVDDLEETVDKLKDDTPEKKAPPETKDPSSPESSQPEVLEEKDP